MPSQRQAFVKRLMDIALAMSGLLILSPALLVIAALIRFDSPGPALFRQTRLGRGGKPFTLYKLRSMSQQSADLGRDLTVGADPRITRMGKWLRMSKLDELPQLYNVLIGDMSLVGPRPETPHLMELYTSEQRALVTSVRPGLTDYASLVFRDEAAILAEETDPIACYRNRILPRKCALCRVYLNDPAPLQADVRIIAATAWVILFRSPPFFLPEGVATVHDGDDA